jgi:hypothetical protein
MPSLVELAIALQPEAVGIDVGDVIPAAEQIRIVQRVEQRKHLAIRRFGGLL